MAFTPADGMDVGTWGHFSTETSPAHRESNGGLLVGTWGHFKQLIGATKVCLPTTMTALFTGATLTRRCDT